jgi:hypothetical protein
MVQHQRKASTQEYETLFRTALEGEFKTVLALGFPGSHSFR